MSRADENMKVGSALKSQLSRLSQLESDNKKLTEDNLYLRQPDLLFIFQFILKNIHRHSSADVYLCAENLWWKGSFGTVQVIHIDCCFHFVKFQVFLCLKKSWICKHFISCYWWCCATFNVLVYGGLVFMNKDWIVYVVYIFDKILNY